MSGELPFCASVRVRTAPHFTVVPLPLVLLPSSDSLVSWPPSMIPSPSPCSYASSPRPLVHIPSCMLYICTYIHTTHSFLYTHSLSCTYISPTTLHSFTYFPSPMLSPSAPVCLMHSGCGHTFPHWSHDWFNMSCWHLAWAP